MSKLSVRAAAFSLAIACAGCASGSSKALTSEQLSALDFREQTLYLAYYPELNAEQRRALLEPDVPFYYRLKEWGLAGKFYGAEKEDGTPGPVQVKPENYTIRKIEVETDAPDSQLSSRDRVKLRAFARYADGRKTEITDDVLWSATPEAVTFDDSTARYGCLNGELAVSAQFLGNRYGHRTLQVRKPLRELEIRIAPQSLSADENGVVDLEAVAHCQDGSEQKVTCQAGWKIFADGVEMGGCGHVLRKRSASKRRGLASSPSGSGPTEARVHAEYGDKSTTVIVELPEPRPAGGRTSQSSRDFLW